MSLPSQIVLALLILSAIVLGGYQLVGPRLAKYNATDDAIELILFGQIPVWRSSYEDISEIKRISFAKMMVAPALHLMSRPFAEYILVRRRRGLFRNVVITPDQANEFIRLVRDRIGDEQKRQ